MDEITLQLNSPITDEQWDTIMDIDFDHTDRITFHTKHGKEVDFVKFKPIKTNADNIRKMSDDELAMLLQPTCPPCDECPSVGGIKDCYKCWLNWLKQEAEESEN